MNASGKTISSAPLPAASAASLASLSIVASRSRITGSAWTHAALTGRMRPLCGNRYLTRRRAAMPRARWSATEHHSRYTPGRRRSSSSRRSPRGSPASSRDERWSREGACARNHALRVEAEPLLEQRRVDAAEIGGGHEVAVAVEAGRPQARELADHPPPDPRPDQERSSAGAVVGPRGAVLIGPAAELRPDE